MRFSKVFVALVIVVSGLLGCTSGSLTPAAGAMAVRAPTGASTAAPSKDGDDALAELANPRSLIFKDLVLDGDATTYDEVIKDLEDTFGQGPEWRMWKDLLACARDGVSLYSGNPFRNDTLGDCQALGFPVAALFYTYRTGLPDRFRTQAAQAAYEALEARRFYGVNEDQRLEMKAWLAYKGGLKTGDVAKLYHHYYREARNYGAAAVVACRYNLGEELFRSAVGRRTWEDGQLLWMNAASSSLKMTGTCENEGWQ